MGKDDAVCISDERCATLRVKRSVWLSAKELSNTASHRRANFTLTHEYSHIVLCHNRAPMARATGVNASSRRPGFIPAYRSAEHQANFVAGTILIDPKLAAQYKTAADISLRFNVSVRAAEIFVDERSRQQKSPLVSAGLRELRRSLDQPTRQASSALGGGTISQDNTVCPTCGLPIRHSVGGNRSRCLGCKTAGDALQDGDPFMGF
jgi:hypothetical protein